MVRVAVDNEGLLIRDEKHGYGASNGIQEIEAYKAGERCSIKPQEIFTMMIQNLVKKGSNEVVIFLKDMSNEAWKKKEVKRKVKRQAGKLIMPIGSIWE